MNRKILVLFVVCLGLLALIPNGSSTNTLTVHSRGQNQGQFSTIASTSNDTIYANSLQVQSNDTGSIRGLFYMPFIFDIENVQNVQIGLKTFSLHNGGYNISVYSINNSRDWNPGQVTWNTRNVIWCDINQTWNSPGGDYNHTALDTVEVKAGTSWFYWNITQFFLDNVNNQSTNNYYGFIFISDNADSTFRGATFVAGSSSDRDRYPKMIYTYSGTTTNLTKDIWNLKGYAGESNKLASTIFSEITYCTAISWKNATTGYWYTYWPSLGLTEDAYLEFGDGLFILTSQDTTWDHT